MIVNRIRDELEAWENGTQIDLVFSPDLPTQYFLAYAFPDIAEVWEELWQRIDRARNQYRQMHTSIVLVPSKLDLLHA